MLFITPTTNGVQAKDYYTRQLSPSDYYTHDASEMKGQWHGLGAELLGLQGEVKQKDFFALCDNLHPQTGEPLTGKTLADRRVLYDFTFDAPKSVSLAYEVGGDERVLGAFQSAVRDTMAEMEGAMKARVRKNGEDRDRVTANMVWAEFIHRTTRPVDGVPDPQLHCHGVVFNASYDDEESKWKAAQFGDLVRDKGYYQAAFHSRLSGNLAKLNYGIERDGNSFRLIGIDRALSDKFSRRSGIIEAEAERLGITDPKAKGELGRRTREKKDDQPRSMAALREEWRSRLSEGEREAITFANSGNLSTTLNAKQGMDYALFHSFERSSAVTDKDLLKQALIQSLGRASVDDVKGELSRENTVLKQVGSQTYATTKEVCREELSMLDFARNGQGKHRKLGGEKKAKLDDYLSTEQRIAAEKILHSRDTVTGLSGGAGTGKTRMMQATVKAIEEGGKQVFTFAPSAKASRGVLREEGFASANTVEKLLTDPDLQRKVQGQVLWIDEAGLLSTKEMKRIFDLAEKRQARVILSGDSKQHSSVVRGDALRLLQRDAGMQFAELKQVRRQTHEAYREAITAISQGDAQGSDGRSQLEVGIESLDKLGAIIEVEADARYRHIAADYVGTISERNGKGERKSVLVVSPTHAEAGKVTEAIRDGLKSTGEISGVEREVLSLKALGFTEAQRHDRHNYRPGDVIQFVQNAKGGYKRGERMTVKESDSAGVLVTRENGKVESMDLGQAARFQVYEAKRLPLAAGDRIRITQNGVSRETRRGARSGKSRLNNGDVFQVAGFEKNGDIRLANGFVLPKDYGGISHGYVVTSHASQGTSVDKVLIALGTESLAATDRQQFYVSASRGREAVRLYTDDKAAVMEAVKGNGARLSATELMADQMPPRRKRSAMEKVIQARTINRVYQAERERIASWTPPVRRKEASRGI